MYNYKFIEQSSWIGDYYNELEFDKRKGFLVEFGVGNVIDYPGRDLNEEIPSTFKRIGSNTSELLDLGWKGLYVEPIIEFLNQCVKLHEKNLDRLTLLNCAASNQDEELVIGDGESLVSNSFSNNMSYTGRKVKCVNANKILEKYCPNKIDLMSLDVEGCEDKVLSAINFNKFNFQMIVVEIDKVPFSKIESILPKNYEKIHHDYLNALYINSQFNN